MKIKLETITPDAARRLLKNNTRNRRVRQGHVDFLASEMANGRWKTTSETIAISPDGTLVDGQHRLLAVSQSGATVDLWVARDVPMETQDFLDGAGVGGGRNISDQLHLDGVAYSCQLVGAARTIVSMSCYYQNPKVSIGMVRIVLNEYQRDIEAVLKHAIQFRPGMKAWVLGSLAFALNADRAVMPFIEAFGSGENLSRGHPAKAARDWLTNGGVAIRSSYRKHAIEGLLNAAYNSVVGNQLSTIRRGSQGVDYFTGKKRKFIISVREQMKQQLEIETV